MNKITMSENMANRATVTFHTSPEVKERLDALAKITRRSKSFLTNEAVERYLVAEEEFVAAVQEGIADADAGRTFTTEEVRTKLHKRINKIAKVNATT